MTTATLTRVRSLFEHETFYEMMDRINALTPDSEALWGKMNVAQMLAHCKEAFKVPLSETKLPRHYLGYAFGWMIKSKLYNDAPWQKNLPTAPNFLISGERNFNLEHRELIDLINTFYTRGPEETGKFPHPFFGRFTPEQWGRSMYKHLDHHLRQFGV